MIRIIDEELREACAIGDETKAQLLVGQGANVNSANKVNGWTALHWAAYRGHRGLVMFLLNKGADPTIQNKKGETVIALLSKHSLDLLDGKEVEEASQYPLPSQQDTLTNLPIVPNYIKNPEFPYSTKKETKLSPSPSTPCSSEHTPSSTAPPVPETINSTPVSQPHEVVVPGQQVPTQQPSGHLSATQQVPPQQVAVQQMPSQQVAVQQVPDSDVVWESVVVPSSEAGTPPTFGPPKPVPGRHFNVQRKPAAVPTYRPYTSSGPPVTAASQPIAQNPQYAPRYGVPINSSSHPPTMMMSVPLASTRTTAPVRNPIHRYPPSEYSIQRVARPQYALPSHSRPPVNVHWRPYSSGNPCFMPMAQQGGPVAIAPRPTMPTSPQIITIPDQATERDSPSTKGSPPEKSESTASTSPCPSTVMDATIKVRLMGSEDFFEVELSDVGETYVSLTECFAEELDITVDQIAKVRKLPNILIRKDRDVKRVKPGSEFEVELVKNGDV